MTDQPRRMMVDHGDTDQPTVTARRPRLPRPATRTATPIVPQNSTSSRTLMFLIAIMTFLSCVTLGTVVLIQKSAIAWSSDVGREVTIQIRPVDDTNILDAIQRATSIASAAPGVGTVTPMSEDDSKQLLEPWLGAGLDLGALNVPRMIIVELSDPREAELEQLATDLQTVPGASLDTHSAWQQQLNTMSGTMVISGLFVLVLIITATVLAIIFATRGTMASNRAIVDVLHFVGASNRFIADEFQGRFLSIGLKGGIVGGAAALLFFIILGIVISGFLPNAAGNQLGALFGSFALGWQGLIAIIILVPFIAGLTAVTSRMTVRRFLTQIS